jgi:glycosyltransferase involved in cell wall biosynthesis
VAKQGKKTKIALVGYKLAKGGLERVFSTVSDLLDEADFEVSVIVLENEIEYSYSGTLINLGNYSKVKKYFQLRKQLKSNEFDYIIDFRHRINPWMELVFLHYIYFGFKSIYTIHSSKLAVYLTGKEWVAKQILKKAYKIVAVSNGLNQKIISEFGFENAVVIPNSISRKSLETKHENVELPYKYCIAVGRLVELKQFDKLIETYVKLNLPKEEIHLVILGEGEEKMQLQKRIDQLEIKEFVHLLGFKNDVFSYIEKAEFLVLSSKYEGFSMVILEALSLSTPVISFDCESGPRELIIHEYNGLLVENQNFVALENSLNRMTDDETLYNFCKKNAKDSVKSFSAENVSKKWLDLLNNNKN